MATPPRKRLGCLGNIVLLALLLVVVAVAAAAITNPWIFTVGGHFRWLPVWTGSGQIDGPGGPYRIFVSFYPARGGSRILPSTSVSGDGWICTPSGKDYRVRIRGGAPLRVWRDMNDQPFSLNTYTRGVMSTSHEPPKLHLVGRWNGADLVLNDTGTVASAFAADGSLIPHPGAAGPKKDITFKETSWWFGNPCGLRTRGN